MVKSFTEEKYKPILNDSKTYIVMISEINAFEDRLRKLEELKKNVLSESKVQLTLKLPGISENAQLRLIDFSP